IVERANAYFNGLSTLVGDFVQTGGDGRRLTGKLYLQRPGRMRFEYAAPATLEVVADGSSVAVRDRRLATQDLYSIGQTPLKFLLRANVDIGRDIRVTEAATEADGVRLGLEDRSTLGGTSKITLYFDPEVTTLRRWRIVDPQGFTTTVALANLETGRRLDSSLFAINYERMLGDNR
ncbi:MAG TPA: outer-membrane lipoprotein carrier protein LolA, partial [Beijerinckiaceae bacterium]|nr:outer-membrane lipoprotein carrier protein LolA [Beijerinckiaceae bacterium]